MTRTTEEMNDTQELEVETAEETVEVTELPEGYTWLIPSCEVPAGFTAITAVNNKEKQGAKIALAVGTDLDSLCNIYGKDVVYDMAVKRLIVGAQNTVRGMIGKANAETIISTMADWRPGQVTRVKVDNMAITESTLKNMDQDELLALVAKLGIKL